MRNITAALVPLDTFQPADAERFVSWARSQRIETQLDPTVIGYPRTCMFTASANEEQVVAMPVHPVLMLESFLHDPALGRLQTAVAFCRIHDLVVETMRSTGMHESYFLTRNPALAVQAGKYGGWTECLHDPLRKTWLMKLKLCS